MGSVRDFYATGDIDPEIEPQQYDRHYVSCDASGSFDLTAWEEPGAEATDRRRKRLAVTAFYASFYASSFIVVPAWHALGFVLPLSLLLTLIAGLTLALLLFNLLSKSLWKSNLWHVFVKALLWLLVARATPPRQPTVDFRSGMRALYRLSFSRALAVLATASLFHTACAINPATGKSQLSLFTEAEEIELGAEVDREFLSNSRRYDNPELEAYVANVGRRLAAVSERPDLPWSFHIADDEIVNAFALPGGRIYVTRGLLAHLESEAELAGVLGHEIGHVTARHSVNGLSRELAITLGVVAGLALFDVGETGELVSSLGLGLVFLKFSRNQESQADQLGVRYARRAGLDPHGVVEALRVLQTVSQSQDDGWFPGWLSTHPDPDKRWQRLAEETGLGAGKPSNDAEIDTYLARLDGMVYGPDPRNGVIEGNAYIQLRDGFEMRFPDGWEIEREGQTLAAENGSEDAIVMLLPQVAETINEAAEAFGSGDGISIDKSWDETLGGLPARFANFRTEVEEETLWGTAAFVRTPGKIIAILGLAEYDAWSTYGQALRHSMRSIGRVTQPNRRLGEPDRLEIVRLSRAMDARQIARQYSPGVEPATIALLNQVEVDRHIPAGRRIKVVRARR